VSIANFLGEKSTNSRTFHDEVVDLTKYGSILISGNNVDKIHIDFYPISENQQINLSVEYKDKRLPTENYYYYLVKEPGLTVSVNKNDLVTNDQNIINFINNQNNNNNLNNNILHINFNNFSDGIYYKVLIKHDGHGNPIRSVIYKTRYSRTFIYSAHDIYMGSDSPDNFNGGIINSDILLVSSKNINILGHIVYDEFDSIESFVNFAEEKSFTFPSNSNSYLNVIANNVIINSNSFTSDNYMIVNGDYFAFFDSNSATYLTKKEIKRLYYFGSNVSYRRYDPLNEKILSDDRESNNISKEYFATCRILGVEILK
ncbi:MAG: hypothetical protein RMJ36_02695, partial [Candidatus Calescibacterium sp.]|nr:hypothetical protein [Candidatus Calescibacterium sp.]MDW8132548.1 hypothetical protein [Candidatus Calescibacterium sp.]